MKKQTNKQTNIPSVTPSVVPTLTPTPVAPGGFTLGLDLGDRSHYVSVLDAAGGILHEGPISISTPPKTRGSNEAAPGPGGRHLRESIWRLESRGERRPASLKKWAGNFSPRVSGV